LRESLEQNINANHGFVDVSVKSSLMFS